MFTSWLILFEINKNKAHFYVTAALSLRWSQKLSHFHKKIINYLQKEADKTSPIIEQKLCKNYTLIINTYYFLQKILKKALFYCFFTPFLVLVI